MSESSLQALFAERIGGAQYGKGTAIYKFEKIKRAKRAAIAQFPDRELMDFGIGENDQPAAPIVRQALKREVDDPENRGYADNGIQEYKDAAARYMKREFGVELNPVTQVNHCIGSKPALAILPAVFVNPGEITLMTAPGYPVAGTYTKYLGGDVYNMLLEEKNGFLPDFTALPADVVKRAKLMVLNYPNSPTGAVADEKFFAKAIAFGRANGIVVVNDAAHIQLTYNRRPLSLLSIPGALDACLEIHTMSKGWDMIGWRMGFVAGAELAVRAFADVKDNTDSGQFKAVQKAAAVALDDPAIPQRVRVRYKRRLEKMVEMLRAAGFRASMPGGTYFLMVTAPKGVRGGPSFANAEEASQYLIREHMICTVPYEEGEMLRWSATFPANTEQDEDRIIAETKKRLGAIRFVF
ncbi:MAG: LL-diaminopimelate aminotransferase [Candidatus Sumerlaeota bacterium]|nr:LL-diaminopimelate aminotransferase [Candidatus Sumerlaeota bacterium]